MTTHKANYLVRWRQFASDEQGATAIEYAMIAASIGAAIAATVWSLGASVRDLYSGVQTGF
jgi:Flp pilus assembly pilin Flp